jgi:type VI secretion system protein ImpJ
MHLGPHHFQAQNRYVENSIQFAASSLWLAPYGFSESQIDMDAVANGTISLLHARGIFRDGLVFNMPECDPLPAPRNIMDLMPTSGKLTVFLAIPRTRQDGLNCALSPSELNENPRYVAEERPLHDQNTGRDDKPVRLGRKNIQLLLDTEVTDDFTALPLTRIMRSGSGVLMVDPDYVPPCLQISASGRILSMLQRLIEIMDQKSRSISLPVGNSAAARVAFSSREIASFWLLHTVNANVAALRHQFFSKHGHPEELYLELSRLAGALCTFAIDSHPRSLPAYDHDQLEICLPALDRHIREHLEIVIPTNCVSIPLKRFEDYFYAGEILDSRCFDRARWVFAIRSRLRRADLLAKTPEMIKICSRKFIQQLVKRAVPALALNHLQVVPAAISARVETEYFEVDRIGGCWNSIVDTRQVGVYVPGDFPDPEIELLVILET